MFWFRRESRERDLDREIKSHLDLEAEEHRQAGLAAREAGDAARRAFGNPTLAKENTRDQWSWTWLETLGKDARYAVRVLRKNPVFSVTAVVALALGIGANTAIFAVVNAVLLRPLPYPQPQQLVRLWDSYGTPGNYQPVSYPNFRDWRAWNHTFQDMAVMSNVDFVMTGAGDPMHVQGLLVSASLFHVLGVQPILGRDFLPDEDRPDANGSDVIILGQALWRERFAADRGILGRTITLDSKPFTVVGVMPSASATSGWSDADLWVTAALLAETGAKPVSEERGMSFLHAIGRLKPGVSLATAQADMDGVAKALMRAYPTEDPTAGVILRGLQESNTSDSRTTLLLLFGAAGVVFLIACADVGGLVLTRATGRLREMTVRAAIGAGRGRIVRQLLVEGLVLTSIGSVVGLWIAAVTVPLLTRVLRLSQTAPIGLDGFVLGFLLAAAVLSALVFSLAPALQATRLDLAGGLKESAANTSESRQYRFWNSTLVVSQIALAMVLLSSSALLTFSLIRLQRVDLGFQPHHVLTFPVSLPGDRFPQNKRAEFFNQLITRLDAVPGVLSAAASGYLPMANTISRTVLLSVAGREIPMSQRTGIAYTPITPDYFKTIGVTVHRGREFQDQDTAGSLPVVMINESAARKYFGTSDPIGQQVAPGMWNGSGSPDQQRTIVGVVHDIKQTLRDSAPPSIYWPMAQVPSNAGMFVTIRTAVDPLSLTGSVRSVLRAMDKDIPLYNVRPLTHFVSASLRAPGDTAKLVALFAVLALVLTAVGLYGVISYSVARRTREIGVRMALGARPGNLVRAIVRRGLALGILGTAIGLPASIFLARLFRGLLYGVTPQNPWMLAAAAGVLIAVALAASYLPARRAARVDPLITLRYQ